VLYNEFHHLELDFLARPLNCEDQIPDIVEEVSVPRVLSFLSNVYLLAPCFTV